MRERRRGEEEGEEGNAGHYGSAYLGLEGDVERDAQSTGSTRGINTRNETAPSPITIETSAKAGTGNYSWLLRRRF